MCTPKEAGLIFLTMVLLLMVYSLGGKHMSISGPASTKPYKVVFSYKEKAATALRIDQLERQATVFFSAEAG